MPSVADDLVYAADPVTWAREVLGFHPDPWQEQLLRSRSKKIVLNCSRQSGKSTTCAALGLHESIYRRPSFGLVIAPSQDQSAELMMKFDEFRGAVELPSDYLSTDTKLAIKFANGNRFVARPGSEKTARSFSAVTLLLEDEAARVSDDLFNSVRPMLAVSDGRHILMSTPFGKRGHFHKIWSEERDLWESYEIPAEQCPRISPEFLEGERRSNPGPGVILPVNDSARKRFKLSKSLSFACTTRNDLGLSEALTKGSRFSLTRFHADLGIL